MFDALGIQGIWQRHDSDRVVQRLEQIAKRARTYGDFTMHESGSFFVGPAVDEAAGWYERANAALIWFAPSERAVMDNALESDFQGAVTTVEYAVPLKA